MRGVSKATRSVKHNRALTNLEIGCARPAGPELPSLLSALPNSLLAEHPPYRQTDLSEVDSNIHTAAINCYPLWIYKF
jgi:hypothetical protein